MQYALLLKFLRENFAPVPKYKYYIIQYLGRAAALSSLICAGRIAAGMEVSMKKISMERNVNTTVQEGFNKLMRIVTVQRGEYFFPEKNPINKI